MFTDTFTKYVEGSGGGGDGGLSDGAIAGVVIGSVVGAAVIAFLAVAAVTMVAHKEKSSISSANRQAAHA